MSVQEIKNELKQMDESTLRELSAYIFQLRRSQDPERKRKISEKLNSPKAKWLTLEEMDQRLGDA